METAKIGSFNKKNKCLFVIFKFYSSRVLLGIMQQSNDSLYDHSTAVSKQDFVSHNDFVNQGLAFVSCSSKQINVWTMF